MCLVILLSIVASAMSIMGMRIFGTRSPIEYKLAPQPALLLILLQSQPCQPRGSQDLCLYRRDGLRRAEEVSTMCSQRAAQSQFGVSSRKISLIGPKPYWWSNTPIPLSTHLDPFTCLPQRPRPSQPPPFPSQTPASKLCSRPPPLVCPCPPSPNFLSSGHYALARHSTCLSPFQARQRGLVVLLGEVKQVVARRCCLG
jgi:hypothetical protein